LFESFSKKHQTLFFFSPSYSFRFRKPKVQSLLKPPELHHLVTRAPPLCSLALLCGLGQPTSTSHCVTPKEGPRTSSPSSGWTSSRNQARVREPARAAYLTCEPTPLGCPWSPIYLAPPPPRHLFFKSASTPGHPRARTLGLSHCHRFV
jgi:hypothetical protein